MGVPLVPYFDRPVLVPMLDSVLPSTRAIALITRPCLLAAGALDRKYWHTSEADARPTWLGPCSCAALVRLGHLDKSTLRFRHFGAQYQPILGSTEVRYAAVNVRSLAVLWAEGPSLAVLWAE